jgi:hypothetical protein
MFRSYCPANLLHAPPVQCVGLQEAEMRRGKNFFSSHINAVRVLRYQNEMGGTRIVRRCAEGTGINSLQHLMAMSKTNMMSIGEKTWGAVTPGSTEARDEPNWAKSAKSNQDQSDMSQHRHNFKIFTQLLQSEKNTEARSCSYCCAVERLKDAASGRQRGAGVAAMRNTSKMVKLWGAFAAEGEEDDGGVLNRALNSCFKPGFRS